MEISRKKSWTYNLFHLVHSEAPNISWAGYYLHSFVGLVITLLVITGGAVLSYFMSKFCMLHPQFTIPIVYSLGGLIAFILFCRIPIVSRLTSPITNYFRQKFLGSVTFVD